uniref:Jacalin-type lectin domain-containing protein n=1 Tax=Oryza glumipatula TaxID=40148 RepID=A0A0E0BHZ0_9ORYZ
MWGASNGTSHDIVEASPKDLISIQIKSIDTIDYLTFTYKDTKGNQQKVSWGGNLGNDQPVDGIKIGMWGGDGTSRDIVEAPRDLISVQIKSKDTIDRLTFIYKNAKGRQTFVLNANEHVTEVYGSVGPFPLQNLPYTVNSITFVTSEGRTYGPWGTRGDNDTDFNVPLEKGRIVGFYARGDKFISAIGFYIRA